MIQFPNAKINLGLQVIAKRNDGYHDIETVFVPIPLYDALEFVEAKELTFNTSGLAVPGNQDDNLVMKAYHLLKQDFPSLPALAIYLLKRIPFGAGLGGGSSNASFMLMMLNKHFHLNITKDKILNYAAQLGSDCPFFIHNIPCFAEGRGERLTPRPINLSGLTLVLVKPNIHVNTAWAFSQIKPERKNNSITQLLQQPFSTWKEALVNDFEAPIFEAHPSLQEIKSKLYNLGAVYAAMSGSGSTIFGLFEKAVDVTSMFKEEEIYVLKFSS